MTASSAGGSTCLTARGLDISLAALRRQDPYIKNIVDVASQVALYTFNSRLNEWEKTDVEGTLFVYTRLASPRHGFTIQNRLSMDNLTEPITKDLDFQLQDPFLLYRNARLAIHGVWFYDKQDCQRIAQLMKNLTQQEQVLAQPQSQPQLQGWRSPGTMEGGGKGGGEGEGKGVDILQMLTNARCDYDKGGKPEPKEILCSTLHDNPNLIKPIPVKPTSQDSEGTEPRQLSLATLFGSQPPCLDPYSPRGQPQPGAVRPAVARSLSYEDPDGKVIPGSTRTGVSGERGPPEMWPLVGAGVGTEYAGGGHKAGDGSAPAGPNQPQQQQQQQQHCPAIQKLMTPSQGQRGAGELLQAVSQSSEIRLWQNGAPLLHPHPHRQHQHQQHHLVYQHLHHHHHHQPHQQPFHSPSPSQTRPDPIQRLFQNQPPLSSSVPSTTATFCGSHPLPQQPPVLPALQAAQPRLVDSQGYGQPQQPVFYSPSRPHPPPQPIVPAGQDPTPPGTDLPLAMQAGPQPHLPGIASLPGVFHPTSAQVPALSGQISGMPGPLQGVQGVVSPHELLQRLQLVQQEQRQGPAEPPRPSPGLAPRFPAAGLSTAGLSAAPASGQYSSANLAQRAGLQLQVISPQRIPATVAPTTLLLSPSVFSQSKAPPPQTDSGPPPSGPRAPPPGSEDTVALSRSQLQATLLHLIQTDSSFLDTIYSSYISRLTHDKGSTKY